jgi:pimeloyl-ACP methyl ester carboxylesterase
MKLFFRELGQGKPIIILHGLFGSSDNWLTQAKLFAPHYRVFSVDQRNHGQSPHSDDFDYSSMVADLNEFIQDRGISDPVIIGHSMGGKTAMNLALAHADKISN